MLSRTSWHTSDTEEAAGAFSQTFGNTKIDIHEKSPALDVHFDVISLGNASLVRNRLGPEVTLFCEGTRDFLLTVARKGRSTFRFNGEACVCDRRRGAILSPVRNLSIRRSHGSENTILRMESESVHRTLKALIGGKLSSPIVFEPRVDVRNGAGASMRRYVEHLFTEVSRGDTGMAVPQVAEATSRALITDALLLLRHNYSRMLTGHGRKPLIPVVKCVEEFIEENHRKNVNDGILADVGGKSASTLYRIFMKHRGYTPMQYLRQVRMRVARKRLLSPEPDNTVTSIALECGFTHLSRFALDYRRQYGENPSETLRKALLS